MKSIDGEEFVKSLTSILGQNDALRAIEAMKCEPSVSVRLNPSKKPVSEMDMLEESHAVPWNSHAFILDKRPVFTLDPLFHAGAYYVQESSAMFVGWLFREILKEYTPCSCVRVLDLCAAPGGKTTDIAASLREVCGDDFLLVSNEVMRQRASVLVDNTTVWGDPNVVVTSVDPKAFALFEGFFDIIVTDVPCSGEGMFRKDAKAVEDWSLETVELCSQRQRRILADVWPALRPGGALIYSTCTFEPSENDLNLKWVAQELGGTIAKVPDPFGVRTTECGHLLVPGEVPGEGQWAGALKKDDLPMSKRATWSFQSSVDQLARLRPLRAGVHKGETKGKDFVPDSDWALSYNFERGEYPEFEVDRITALRFLHKDSFTLDGAPLGYLVLTYGGLPLGFVKNLGKRCNNLHPQSRRIRMDINKYENE